MPSECPARESGVWKSGVLCLERCAGRDTRGSWLLRFPQTSLSEEA